MLQDHSISGPWGFLVKEEVQCLCEGGRNCAHENPARQKAPNAIAGLHSSWVGDEVLAMARPWQENVLKHDVVSQFKQQNIGMILNIQEVRHLAVSCVEHLKNLMLLEALAARRCQATWCS
jgi:protein tyrosine phosphatase domain-containing protein 1